MTEEWRPIPDQDGWYEVSNFGNVRSWKNARWGRRSSPLPLKQWVTEKGYRCVRLGTGGPKFRVHRLVLLIFAGEPPIGKELALHGDGNPANNRLCNLRWGTAQENSDDMISHGNSGRGEKKSILTETDIQSIRILLNAGNRSCELADYFGVSRSTISDIKHRRTWAWLP